MNSKDILKEIKQLKKLKKKLKVGSKERKDIHLKIKSLKEQVNTIQISNTGKDKLIKEIKTLTKDYLHNIIDYTNYTEEQLLHHLNKLKDKRGL
jgi:uncharacterized radical SAM superfamily protein